MTEITIAVTILGYVVAFVAGRRTVSKPPSVEPDYEPRAKIADIVHRLNRQLGGGIGATAARDLLIAWEAGQFEETLEAWEQYITDKAVGAPITTTERHGELVPAIPL